MILKAQNISHAFGELRVLRSIDLSVRSGESVAVIGPNGAGKTTLLRILAGLLESDEGDVEIDGEPLADLERREVAQHLSVVPQATPKVFDFTALDLVLMGFHARTGRFSLPSKKQRNRALEAMERLEIADIAERPASVISGGELQRTLMARTMVSETSVWLLDEPTSHLDVRHQVALLEQVRRHARNGGCSVAILHDFALVHRFFDRALVLKDGDALASGDVDETLTEDLLARVFEVPLARGTAGGHVAWAVK